MKILVTSSLGFFVRRLCFYLENKDLSKKYSLNPFMHQTWDFISPLSLSTQAGDFSFYYSLEQGMKEGVHGTVKNTDRI